MEVKIIHYNFQLVEFKTASCQPENIRHERRHVLGQNMRTVAEFLLEISGGTYAERFLVNEDGNQTIQEDWRIAVGKFNRLLDALINGEMAWIEVQIFWENCQL